MGLWTLLVVKNLPMQETQETWVRSLGQEDPPPEKETVPHSRILAWEISWTGEPGGLQSMGSQRVGHDRVSVRTGPWASKRQARPGAAVIQRHPFLPRSSRQHTHAGRDRPGLVQLLIQRHPFLPCSSRQHTHPGRMVLNPHSHHSDLKIQGC